MKGKASSRVPETAPAWVPVEVKSYLAHVEAGQSMREIARRTGCHASTILRQIRRTEARRDDVLVDRALDRLRRRPDEETIAGVCKGIGHMTTTLTKTKSVEGETSERTATLPDEKTLKKTAPTFLKRLCEADVSLAYAKGMDTALLVRPGADGTPIRLATMESAMAEAFALKEWIKPLNEGRITRYRITPLGRLALKRLVAEEEVTRVGAEAQPFAAQHGEIGEKEITTEAGRKRRVRYNAGESPLQTLSRRTDKEGKPFLDAGLVAAGERLREDFELAHMGPRVAQNWDRFLTGGARGEFGSGDGGGSDAARRRVVAALEVLGPGLGDVVLHCCCFLEGLEAVERRMGWSARSGKVVLRIALTRLRVHYENTSGLSPLIG